MTKTLCSVVFLASATAASGTVRIFVTSSADLYGLENQANAFIPTVSTVFANGVNVNGFDYWADPDGTLPGPIRPGSFPPADAPTGTAASPIEIQPGDFAYVWLQYQSEPAGAKINGLAITIRELGTTVPAPVTTNWYVCNNMNNVIEGKRWDGTATPPDYPEWHGNPQTFVAITAYGLQNKAADLPWNLWKGGTARLALLGAVQAPADGTIYELHLQEICYFVPPSPSWSTGFFQFVPEPAGGLLVALSVALLRTRRASKRPCPARSLALRVLMHGGEPSHNCPR